MKMPRQAVILCGGLGTRLRPLTDTLPKPLAPINGRPFLAYLIAQLREQQIQRVLLLTGYKGEMIRDYFEGRANNCIQIDYSSGPTEWETGRRLWEARERLDECFMLLYSDNYVLTDISKLTGVHTAGKNAITLTVHSKQNGNIKLDPCGQVVLYDSSRADQNLNYVEIGYMLVDRNEVLNEFSDTDVSFSRILGQLVRRGRVGAVNSGDAYHSISDVERWKRTEHYLKVKRIILIDRDGTINQRAPRGEYVARWDQFYWIDETFEAMRQLSRKGFRFIVVSNQAGIARGMLEPSVVEEMNDRMVAELKLAGVEVIDVYVCPHHWDDNCSCRKPQPGLFFRASKSHLLRMSRTVYVGDDPRDSRAAFNAGCLSVLIGPERNCDPGGGRRLIFRQRRCPRPYHGSCHNSNHGKQRTANVFVCLM